ncbi:MAG: hypothetical protein H0T98_03380 [Euzebyaceae bacterium]|jgi:hypothetical protein|nr:hypothetical protein [Euzebyaceae bacterium]
MDIPVACTLNQDEMADRRALWQRIDADVVERRRLDGRFEVVYAPTPEVERLLPLLVDAESVCCAFARWQLIRNLEGVVLAVSGPSDGVAALGREFSIE